MTYHNAEIPYIHTYEYVFLNNFFSFNALVKHQHCDFLTAYCHKSSHTLLVKLKMSQYSVLIHWELGVLALKASKYKTCVAPSRRASSSYEYTNTEKKIKLS